MAEVVRFGFAVVAVVVDDSIWLCLFVNNSNLVDVVAVVAVVAVVVVTAAAVVIVQ